MHEEGLCSALSESGLGCMEGLCSALSESGLGCMIVHLEMRVHFDH